MSAEPDGDRVHRAGSPWQNPYVESFHSRVHNELRDVEEFSCLAEAQVVISDWQEDYDQQRQHSALGMKSARRVRRRLAAGGRARSDRLTAGTATARSSPGGVSGERASDHSEPEY